jgi:hypothetical protein
MTLRFARGWIGCSLVALLGGACSSSNETSGGGGTSGTAGRSGSAGAAGTASGSGGGQSVGPAGGIVAQAGVTLSVPANALSSTTMITVSPTTAPSGYALAS